MYFADFSSDAKGFFFLALAFQMVLITFKVLIETMIATSYGYKPSLLPSKQNDEPTTPIEIYAIYVERYGSLTKYSLNMALMLFGWTMMGVTVPDWLSYIATIAPWARALLVDFPDIDRFPDINGVTNYERGLDYLSLLFYAVTVFFTFSMWRDVETQLSYALQRITGFVTFCAHSVLFSGFLSAAIVTLPRSAFGAIPGVKSVVQATGGSLNEGIQWRLMVATFPTYFTIFANFQLWLTGGWKLLVMANAVLSFGSMGIGVAKLYPLQMALVVGVGLCSIGLLVVVAMVLNLLS
jgi:hypothetical protein